MRIAFITGPPGSGKDYLCGFLRNNYGAIILATGEILERSRDFILPSGKTVGAVKDRGEIVPAPIAISLLGKEIRRGKRGFIVVNGFPRDIDQARFLESEKDFESIVFYLKVKKNICADRIINASDRGNRPDDSPDKIFVRQNIFERETLPAVKYLEGGGVVPVVTLDGRDSGEKNSFLVTKKIWGEKKQI